MADEAMDMDTPTLLLDENTTILLPDDVDWIGLDLDEVEVETMYDSDTR